jgi:hypothetical protein
LNLVSPEVGIPQQECAVSELHSLGFVTIVVVVVVVVVTTTTTTTTTTIK